MPSGGEINQIFQNFSAARGNSTYRGPVSYWSSSLRNADNGVNAVTWGFNSSSNILPVDNGGRAQVLCVRK